jgi:hypothetical protein
MLREPGDHVAAARRREEETWTGVAEDWLDSLDSLGESEPLEIGRPLAQGQRVRVFGGYDTNPAWLKDDPDGYEGVVVEFIPGRNELPAAVVALDVPLFAGGIEGGIVVLEQAWEGIRWGQTSPRVHVELCDFEPEHARWQERRRGAWIESHATFEVVAG